MNKKLCMLLVAGLLLAITACGANRSDDSPNYAGWGGSGNVIVEHMGAQSSRPVSIPAPPAEMLAAMADSAPAPVMALVPGNAVGGAGDVTWEDIHGQNERHVIRRASLDMQSENFDDTVEALRGVAPSVNGYIESEVLTGTGARRLTIVLRVPVATFDAALHHVQSLGTVNHQSQSAEDVTAQFYDLAGNLETRRIEEERILSLIERAEDIHELLALEARLSNVRQTIASYLAQLNQIAGLVSYSTITVTLTEYNPWQPVAGDSLGERIGGAFGDSVDGTVSALQGIVVFLAGAVIPLALLAIVGLVIWMIVKATKKRTVYS